MGVGLAMLRISLQGFPSVLLLVILQGMGARSSRYDSADARRIEAECNDLDEASSLRRSKPLDGKFLYASSWKAATITVFASRPGEWKARAPADDHRQRQILASATAVALSHHGRLVAVPAFQSRAVSLYRRDTASGELTQIDVATNDRKGPDLSFPVDAAFSADSEFLYVVNDHGLGNRINGSLVTFRIKHQAAITSRFQTGSGTAR